MSKEPGEDSIAERLERTSWDYSQNHDRRFLLDPIGQIFGTFCWDGKPKKIAEQTPEDDDDSQSS